MPREPVTIEEGTCSDCNTTVKTSPRGTSIWCWDGCGEPIAPAGVNAPYERGGTVTRQARSPRETDMDALDLAGRKGIMLGQLRALAAGDRLDDAAAMKTEWFSEQVRDAKTGARLDDLATLFAEARIKPKGWFRKPDAITAGYDDDQDDGEYDDQDDGDQPAAIPAAPAAPVRATWADALDALGYRLGGPPGACALTDRGGRNCTQPTGGHPPVKDAIGRDGWTCSPHYNELGRTLTAINRQRGITP